jgi:hypothetical protein
MGDARLPFPHLLGAAMVVADVGNAVHDLLAVELEDNAQHAVSSRMLRAEVEEHVIRIASGGLHSPIFRTE